MSVIQLSHDAFGRFSVMRESVPGYGKDCACCGANRKTLFRYGIELDGYGARTNWLKGVFCNVSCARDYHGNF
jgi:hypothetical protein